MYLPIEKKMIKILSKKIFMILLLFLVSERQWASLILNDLNNKMVFFGGSCKYECSEHCSQT